MQHVREYRCHNRIEDILSASEAWHALAPKRELNSEQALVNTFNKLDLDGSGKIDAYELKEALLQMQHDFDPAQVPFGPGLDAKVAEMILWADRDNDGLISFEDYKRVITVGCEPEGAGRILGKVQSRDGAKAGAKGSTITSDAYQVHVGAPPTKPDPDTIYL